MKNSEASCQSYRHTKLTKFNASYFRRWQKVNVAFQNGAGKKKGPLLTSIFVPLEQRTYISRSIPFPSKKFQRHWWICFYPALFFNRGQRRCLNFKAVSLERSLLEQRANFDAFDAKLCATFHNGVEKMKAYNTCRKKNIGSTPGLIFFVELPPNAKEKKSFTVLVFMEWKYPGKKGSQQN